MPRIPKIYLETTMFNFPFADDAPQYRADTLRLFEEIRAGRFQPYTSEYVIRELEAATDTFRKTGYAWSVNTPWRSCRQARKQEAWL
jgi:hypothetical protein